MTSWREEWKSAKLHLRLRGSQLFHGETVAIDVSPAEDAKRRRWMELCDGASIDIKVVAEDVDGRRRDASLLHAATPRPSGRHMLLRQQSELAVVPSGGHCAKQLTSAHCLLLLRAEVELAVRSEFWGRPLALIARVTPKDAVTGSHAGLELAATSCDDPVRSGALLSDEWLSSSLLPLIREESTAAPSLTKRLEFPITIVKVLQVQVETRALTGQRLAVVVSATNTRDDISLAVLDLQLHVNNSPPSSCGNGDGDRRLARRYRVLDDSKAPFPVSLLALERYNFVFVLEPMDPPVREPSPAGILGRVGSADTDERADDGPEHALLTLTWKAADRAARAVTEQHAVAWSPSAISLDSAPPSVWPAAQQAEWTHVVAPHAGTPDAPAVGPSAMPLVRLRADSALHVSLVPPSRPPRVGHVATACVSVTNRSQHATFDLTLVLPCSSGLSPQSDARDTPEWISFEASHHLGLVRPGKSVRKSVHLALLSAGATLDAVVLVDALTRTCFLSRADR